ncbi:MAG: S8 family peptidase [Chitinophagaceae bacterium]
MILFFMMIFVLGISTPVSGQPGEGKLISKISPSLKSLQGQPANTLVVLTIMVRDTKQFLDSMVVLTGTKLLQIYDPANIIIVKTPLSTTNRLAGWDNILFIDHQRKAMEEFFTGTIENETNLVNRMQFAYPAYNANTITVGIKENAFDTADIDFKGRVLINPAASSEISNHATVMGTIAAGGGNTWYATKAAAWGARIVSSSFANLLPDNNNFFQQYSVTVQNHSYGTGIENYYGPEAVAYDMLSASNPALLHIFSSGNSGQSVPPSGIYAGITGFANLTGQFKMAKNILTVGAIDSFYTIAPLSSKGPAYDGRVKPELVAQGEDGSSGSAAIVSGIAAALQQAYRINNSNNLPPSALIKAILVNSANDVGPPEVDFQSGFGSVNGYKAMKMLANGNFTTGSVLPGQEIVYNLTVPAGIRKLKVTLAWNDPPATVNATKALVNDIDLELSYPAGSQTWLPWVLNSFPHRDSLSLPAVRKRDGLNNTEQVTLNNPVPGNYSIRTKGFAISSASQAFALAWQLDAANNFEWNYPQRNDPVLAGQQNVLRWESTLPVSTAVLQYSLDNGNSWQVISNSADLSPGYYKWIAPLVYSKALVKITNAGNDYRTDTVVISKRLNLSVAFNCPDSFMLFWPRVQAASQYQLYKLGSKYMEPLQLLADTSIVLQKNNNSSLYYAVAPVIGGREGVRSFATNYTDQGVQCYFRSFYAERINNTARIQLELGSLYNINSITVQKIIGRDTFLLQTISNPSSLQYTFTDVNLQNGLNQYRVYLGMVNGSRIYSDIIPLYFSVEEQLFIFPNPVRQGASFSVVFNERHNGELQIIDINGRILQRLAVATDIIQLPATKLPAGIYLLRLAGYRIPVKTAKLVVY